MSLLSRHIAVLQSEEFVLGVSTGFRGDADSRFAGIESTKIVIVAAPASKNWIGYTTVEQSVADASVGESMVDKQFPARCRVTYKRVTASETKTYEGKSLTKDVEKLVVTGIEYLSPVDIVDCKVAPADRKAA
ncbi:MAG: hypothetical protein HGA75_00635 [Thiobacillus sp.]|nr:hypothetical protein [Thiobacillus sp.]